MEYSYEMTMGSSELSALAGNLDENLNSIEMLTGARLLVMQDKLVLSGSRACVELAKSAIDMLLKKLKNNETIDFVDIRAGVDTVILLNGSETEQTLMEEGFSDVIAITAKGRRIKPKTPGQRFYVNAIKENTVTLCIGPAGTGKTYLAMALAVVAFKNKEIERIVLTRPAVEAGEKLGFLPGDMQNKVDPYLRPLYDALYDFMGADAYKRLSERGIVEVAPLAYMRGRTLQNSFIILDEAQNCTPEQMKMFLTRLGENSKIVVTGDITQTDLPPGKPSGLKQAIELLNDIEGIGVIRLSYKDVVRHRLVSAIIRAYEGKGGRDEQA